MKNVFKIKFILLSAIVLCAPYSLPAQQETLTKSDPAPAPVATPNDTNKTSDDKSSDTPKDFASLPWKGTIMFDNSKLKELYKAVDIINSGKSFANNKPKDENGKPLFTLDINKEDKKLLSPVYALNSVLFDTPDMWTIWVNGTRIRKGQSFIGIEELQVLDVRHDQVELLWHSTKLNLQSPNWQSVLKPLSDVPNDPKNLAFYSSTADGYEWNYKSNDGNILLDSKSGVVKIRLGINQSFVANEMKIAEGIIEQPTGNLTYNLGNEGGGVSPQPLTDGANGETAIQPVDTPTNAATPSPEGPKKATDKDIDKELEAIFSD